MVFQDPTGALNPRQTIYESVAEGLRIHKVPRRRGGRWSREALSNAGLRPPERFFLRYPHELSGGQRQRVVIAGALVLEPEVIVADEPVSNLDASVRGEILRLLLELRDALGLTMLVVTHDLGLAWTIADRVAVMYLGRIVEIGPAEEVLLRPQHPYTKALLDVVPEAGGIDRPILPGEPPDPTRIPDGCRFHPRCPLVATRARSVTLGIEAKCTGRGPGSARSGERTLRGLPRGEPGIVVERGAGALRSRRARPRPSSPPFRTPRIASISESPTCASRGVSLPRTEASNVLKLDSAISARASSSRTFDPRTSARCSASTRASRDSRASSLAARRLARRVATSRPSSTNRSTAARPTSEYIDPVAAGPEEDDDARRGFRGRRPMTSRSPGSTGRASSRR